ncbi:uncharacterized protein CELE_Y18D10A.4 [Caenorhabditis elegans]|uniref:Uncharacterized protein n=1 Tax=Caenorhabditis elegans TaxID=6239 RepID=Q9XW23_CAEEL|nr:Uncharacterized protein CELE_Y18D10A.4 [Caenorhabditis elegans]CAA22310.1 Uncharacterized protein CELE_Y18D10A.4 [Caenorhabditis elegans]|eukprot:NP_493242.1 Uncharacterized protein CELE_Y18D10A.4 [Caenorhabditis elegans]
MTGERQTEAVSKRSNVVSERCGGPPCLRLVDGRTLSVCVSDDSSHIDGSIGYHFFSLDCLSLSLTLSTAAVVATATSSSSSPKAFGVSVSLFLWSLLVAWYVVGVLLVTGGMDREKIYVWQFFHRLPTKRKIENSFAFSSFFFCFLKPMIIGFWTLSF